MNFDVFISFKNTDKSGEQTHDSIMAEELYYTLKKNGINAFFSKISIDEFGEDKYGTMINEALEQAKIFIAVGTKIEHLNSQWVKYEIQCFNGEMLNGNKNINECAMFSYVTKNVPSNLLPMELRRFQSFLSLDKLLSSVCKKLGVPKISQTLDTPESNNTTEIKKGIVLDKRYEIITELGQGGMSQVYLAWDRKLQKTWAVKVLINHNKPQLFKTQKQSFESELFLLRRLNHPAIPKIVDVIDGENFFIIIMDYISGKNLASILENDGPQKEEQVLKWAIQLCDVLTYLHDNNIIYRDMKPHNLLLTESNFLKLIDFGIAREYKPEKITDTTNLGTRGYAAPEQYGGMGQTDARTDIYALGVTMHNLCTGKNPCEPPYEIYPIRKINKNLSYGLEYIINRCIKNNPEDRYQSAAELKEDLENISKISSKIKRKRFTKDLLTDLVTKSKKETVPKTQAPPKVINKLLEKDDTINEAKNETTILP